MDGMEKEVSAIGGLFLTIMSDLRVRYTIQVSIVLKIWFQHFFVEKDS